MKRFLAAAAVLTVAGFSSAIHDFHVTYGRVAVEGEVVQARIRFFSDDLQEALQAYASSPDLRLDATPATDSIFVAYFTKHFVLVTGSDTLVASIAASGDETDGRESVWWFLMSFESDAPIRNLSVESTLLFEQFDDQKNIIKIQHFPSEKHETYYLTPESPRQVFQID